MVLKSNENGYVLEVTDLRELEKLAYLLDKVNVFFNVRYGEEDAAIRVKQIQSIKCELQLDCDIVRFEQKR